MIRTAQLAIGDAPTLLTVAETDSTFGSSVLIKNVGATDVHVGNSDVTTATGLVVEVGESLTVPLTAPEQLYGVTASAGTVHVLQTGA
jgi:hypothetical protein